MKETYTSTYPLLALSLTGSVAAIILTVWFALTEYQHFYRSQMERMEISAATTNRVVSAFINERKDLVKSFILHNVEKIEEISENPNNEDAIYVFGKKFEIISPLVLLSLSDGKTVNTYQTIWGKWLAAFAGGTCRSFTKFREVEPNEARKYQLITGH
jgi:hypothetical protein